jgi:hypothetical protein
MGSKTTASAYDPFHGIPAMDLRRHLEFCIAALTRYGNITKFDRMRALRNWDDLKHRTDAAAFSEALARLTVRPCLPPTTTPRDQKERRTLARWLVLRAIRSGTVLWLP